MTKNMTEHKRRKEDIIKDKKQTVIQSLYSEPDVVENGDGEYKVVNRFSWRKFISSSIFGLVIAWAVWSTTTIYKYDVRLSVIDEQLLSVVKSLSDEVAERKEDKSILHMRITKQDDFYRDQIRMIQKTMHENRMATFDKVDKAKETLINMMIKILENQEKMESKNGHNSEN